MHCLSKNLHFTFFLRNLLTKDKHWPTVTYYLLNFNDNSNCVASHNLKTSNFFYKMSKKSDKKHCKRKDAETIAGENIKIVDNFFVLDNLPSPILIDIDHPDKYRKKTVKKPSDDIFIDEKITDYSKLKNKYSPKIEKYSENKLGFDRNQKSKTLSKKEKEKEVVPIDTKKEENFKDDSIIYEGTFNKGFIPFQPTKVGFFKKHLCESTTPSHQIKRSLSFSKPPHSQDIISKKHKTFTESTSRRSSSFIDHNDRNLEDKSRKEEYKKVMESINFLSRVPSSSSSDDDDVVIEDEILIEKVLPPKFKASIPSTSGDPLFSTIANDTKKQDSESSDSDSDSNDSEFVDNDSSKPFSKLDIITLNNSLQRKEESVKEIFNSDDSLPRSPTCFNEYKSDSTDMEMSDVEDEDDDEDDSDSGTKVIVDNKNFIPLTSIKLKDIEYDIPITEEVRRKREKLQAIRKWELTGLGAEMVGLSKNIDGTLFTLLSYNVLAQQLIKDNISLYQNCDSKILDWSYRWPLLQHEIQHLQPDIMTFQEVESNHYHTYYFPWFTHCGYKCIYKKRTGTKCDGCLIVYNDKKFTLIEDNSVEFYQPNAGSILDRDNIGLIAKLTPTEFNYPFCVATTHILFNPKRSDVKLAQLVLLLTELDRICYEGEEGGQPLYCPIILTGDFNSEPYSRLLDVVRKGTLNYSGLCKRSLSRYSHGPTFGLELIPPSLGVSDHCQHKVLQQGRYLEKVRGNLFSLVDKRKIEEKLIKIAHSDRNKDIPSSSSDVGCSSCPSQSSGIINHSFNFKSAYYHKLHRSNNAPEVTTFQDRWITVDYIFYTRIRSNDKIIEGDLKLIGRYGLISPAEAMRVGPLPSDICPSDHLPLAAQFLLRRKHK